MPDPVPGNTPICAQRRISARGSTLTLSPRLTAQGHGTRRVQKWLLGFTRRLGRAGFHSLRVSQEGDVLDSNRAQPTYNESAVWTEVDMIPPGQSAAMIAVVGVRAPA
jgi:hypothetical protein